MFTTRASQPLNESVKTRDRCCDPPALQWNYTGQQTSISKLTETINICADTIQKQHMYSVLQAYVCMYVLMYKK